ARAKANLEAVQKLQERCRVLPVDEATAAIYADVRVALKALGRPIPENDVWIAAVCVQHSIPLATRDTHFESVKRLQPAPVCTPPFPAPPAPARPLPPLSCSPFPLRRAPPQPRTPPWPASICSPPNPSPWATPTRWPTRSPTPSSMPCSPRTPSPASPA